MVYIVVRKFLEQWVDIMDQNKTLQQTMAYFQETEVSRFSVFHGIRLIPRSKLQEN